MEKLPKKKLMKHGMLISSPCLSKKKKNRHLIRLFSTKWKKKPKINWMELIFTVIVLKFIRQSIPIFKIMLNICYRIMMTTLSPIQETRKMPMEMKRNCRLVQRSLTLKAAPSEPSVAAGMHLETADTSMLSKVLEDNPVPV